MYWQVLVVFFAAVNANPLILHDVQCFGIVQCSGFATCVSQCFLLDIRPHVIRGTTINTLLLAHVNCVDLASAASKTVQKHLGLH